jgi:hypothetical protein
MALGQFPEVGLDPAKLRQEPGMDVHDALARQVEERPLHDLVEERDHDVRRLRAHEAERLLRHHVARPQVGEAVPARERPESKEDGAAPHHLGQHRDRREREAFEDLPEQEPARKLRRDPERGVEAALPLEDERHLHDRDAVLRSRSQVVRDDAVVQDVVREDEDDVHGGAF